MTRNIHLSRGSLLPILIHALLLVSFTNASHFSIPIQDLDGSLKGQRVRGINEVKLYLNRFGYMGSEFAEKHSLQNNSDHFDKNLETAIKEYQKYYKLKVTGILDSATIKRMNVPRCGAPDNVNGLAPQEAAVKPQYHFFPKKPVWPRSRRHLSYTFNSSAKGAPMSISRGVFAYAFKKWEEVTKFKFHEASRGEKADVVIGFHRGEHGDGRPFDGNGGILAHSFSPTIGALHLDADEKFNHRPKIGNNESDYVWVAMHEIGHILGLTHSSEEKAIMFAYVEDGLTRRALHQDDIMGIHALYPHE
ncbi:hypothetical protein I3842_03G079800 [Carya illinoinensis]|uniref:Peptidase metallopeptidase domain-containing protein n=2 Tax=Carya illinoinensis TaxID=32201 RepID=A0A922FHD6_CARIL|nr:hypothetical protein I3842_03G079800 [Carya illinoinensis]